ncbi:MAG: hypothetical protein QGG42_07440 [Phycisphaerae bacterium]|nr:hypothetical protein [Phycisphaerae bacterium]
MPIQFTCPKCGKQYRVSKDHAGKRTRCTECDQLIQIPNTTAPPVAELVNVDVIESSGQSADNSGARGVLLAIVLLLLVAGGAALYWFVLRDRGASADPTGGGSAVVSKLSETQHELAVLLNSTIWRSADGTHPSLQFDVTDDANVTGSFTTTHPGSETGSGVIEDGRVIGDNRIEFRWRQEHRQGVVGTGKGRGVLIRLAGNQGFRVTFTTSDGRDWPHPLRKLRDRTPVVALANRTKPRSVNPPPVSGFAPSKILTRTLASFRRAVAANNVPAATALFHREGALKDSIGTFVDYIVTASEVGDRMVKAYGQDVLQQPDWSGFARFRKIRDPASWRTVQFTVEGNRARTQGTPTANPLELVLVDGVWLIDPNKSFPVPAGQIDSAVATYARTTRAMKKILPLIGQSGQTAASLKSELGKEP